MQCPKCHKNSLHLHAFSISPECYAKCDNCGFLLEAEVSWIGCENEKEHDNKCVEHLTKLLKEE